MDHLGKVFLDVIKEEGGPRAEGVTPLYILYVHTKVFIKHVSLIFHYSFTATVLFLVLKFLIILYSS